MRQNKPIVLIVDNDTSARGELARALDAAGYPVITADSGESALTLLVNYTVRVAIVENELNDIKGYQLVPKLRNLNRTLKAIMTANESSLTTEIQCREAGIIFFAPKPYNIGEILEAVRTVQFRMQ